MQASADARGGDLLALEGGDDGAEYLGADEIVEDGGVAFLAEPVENVRAEGMIADRAVDLFLQFELALLVLKQARDLRHHAARAAKQQLDRLGHPLLAKSLREGGEDPLLLGGTDLREDLQEVLFLVAQHLGEAGRTGRGIELGLLADLIACEEELEGGGRAQLEALAGCLLGGGDNGTETGRVRKAVEVLDDGVQRDELILQLAGAEELFEDLIDAGDSLLAKDDRFALPGGQGEVAIFLDGLFRAVPPAFPLGLIEDLGHEGVGNLILGGLAAETVEDDAHEPNRVLLRAGFESGEIGSLEGQDMVGRDGLEGLGSVLELHGVGFPPPEIDGQLADQEIDRVHASEPPALVVAKASRKEFFKGLPRLGSEFAGVDGFLDFCIHRAGQDRSAPRG